MDELTPIRVIAAVSVLPTRETTQQMARVAADAMARVRAMVRAMQRSRERAKNAEQAHHSVAASETLRRCLEQH